MDGNVIIGVASSQHGVGPDVPPDKISIHKRSRSGERLVCLGQEAQVYLPLPYVTGFSFPKTNVISCHPPPPYCDGLLPTF